MILVHSVRTATAGTRNQERKRFGRLDHWSYLCRSEGYFFTERFAHEKPLADIIHGKLDQKNSQLEIDYAIGRDIRPEDVKVIINCLQDWCAACDKVLDSVETQIHRANTEKNSAMLRQIDIDQEVRFLPNKNWRFTVKILVFSSRLSTSRKPLRLN